MLLAEPQQDLVNPPGGNAPDSPRGSILKKLAKSIICLPLRAAASLWSSAFKPCLRWIGSVLHLRTAAEHTARAAKAVGLDEVRDEYRKSLVDSLTAARAISNHAARFVRSRRWLATAFGVTMALLMLIVVVKSRPALRGGRANSAHLPPISEALTEPLTFSPAQLVDSPAEGPAFLDSQRDTTVRLAAASSLQDFGPVATAQYQSETGRGATLTGTIEEIADTPPPYSFGNAVYRNAPR